VLDDDVLAAIIHGYTREAGVRSLEREIGRLLRHAAVRIAEGSAQMVTIRAADLVTILGQPRFESEVAMRTSVPGVATGLAWTPAGGDILFIEATRAAGKGSFLLTGQLGDVMKESAQACLLYTSRLSVEGHSRGVSETLVPSHGDIISDLAAILESDVVYGDRAGGGTVAQISFPVAALI